jgi:hypothetical protein
MFLTPGLSNATGPKQGKIGICGIKYAAFQHLGAVLTDEFCENVSCWHILPKKRFLS